jgi:hypothetical protein
VFAPIGQIVLHCTASYPKPILDRNHSNAQHIHPNPPSIVKMAAPTQNPTVRSGPESKSAKKKKSKAESSAAETASTVAALETPTESNHGDGANESPFIKELQK